jgi:hypothetical protein
MNRPAINAFALAPVAAETRTALDDALAQVIRLDTKHMDGQTLTDDESRQYVQAASLLATFSGQVVAQTLQVFIRTPRGQRIIAAALPQVFAINNITSEARGLTRKVPVRGPDGLITEIREEWLDAGQLANLAIATVQEVERDADGEIVRIISRPMKA